MDKELQDKLFKQYPEFFKHRDSIRQSLMCFGFECGNGWYSLISKLCNDIYNYFINEYEGVGYDDETYYHEVPKYFSVQQVKEKFGSLRFYVSSAPQKIHDMIHAAENRSYYICEHCGKEGEGFYRDDLGWILTLCDSCLDEHILKRYNRIRKKGENFISTWQKDKGAPFVEG